MVEVLSKPEGQPRRDRRQRRRGADQALGKCRGKGAVLPSLQNLPRASFLLARFLPLLFSLSLSPLPCPHIVPMAKAAEKKVDKKAKASPAKKAAATAPPKAAAKPISSKEIMAKAKQQVGICALLPPYMHPHHDIGKEVEVEGEEGREQ